MGRMLGVLAELLTLARAAIEVGDVMRRRKADRARPADRPTAEDAPPDRAPLAELELPQGAPQPEPPV